MADGYISQIKTPDNKVYLLKDSEKTDEKVKQTANTEDKEFPIILKNTNNTTNETNGVKYAGGVTVNPSDKTITATEFIGKLNMGHLVPIDTKTYNAPLYQSSGANFYQNFATVTPADYNAIWVAHYRITIIAAGHSDYTEICDVSISGRNNTWYTYKIYNSIVTYSIYQHMLLNSNSATVPHELGYRMQGSYGADTVQKVVKIELLEQLNCTVTLLDNLKLYTSATPSGYTWRSFNSTSNGLQEYGDTNDTGVYIYSNGFKGKAGSNKVYKQCLFARTSNGTYESFVMQNDTVATTKTANPHGFVPDGKIYWNSSNTVYSEGTLNLPAYQQYHVIDYRYSFNFDNTFLPDYCETYVVYTYNEDDGLLYLDTTQWLAAALPTTADGKIYQRIGSKYYTGTSNYYQGSLLLENPYYEYRDGEIRSWSATHLSSITGADDLKAIEAISGASGLLKKTAANTWTLDTNTYLTTHRTYTAFTGKPTGNQTPGFGDTFTIQQISQNTAGQVSGTDRTVKIPSITSNDIPVTLTRAQLINTEQMSFGSWLPKYNSGTAIPAKTMALFADGLAIKSPATANDAAWLRFVGTGEADSVLEIATSDDANNANAEKIVARQYNGSSAIYEAILLGKIGDVYGATSFPVQVEAPKFLKGTSIVPDTGNVTGNVGGASTPVYVAAGVIKPVTLKDTANALINALDTGSSPLTANDYVITQYVGGGTTTTTYHRRPANQVVNGTLVKAALGTVGTTAKKFLKDTGTWTQVAFSDLSGTATNAQLANSKVTIAGNDVSLGGSLTAATLTSSLGLSNALHFIGITSTTLTDGSTTATLTAKTANPSSLTKTTDFVDGDVVMDGDQLREYVWSGSAWRLLGITTSTAYTQPASTATNTWIAQVSQGTDGKITATTGSLNTSGTWSGVATKASYPEGFSSRSTNATWGNQIGATVTCWNESDGGSIDIRKNNPSSGKVSIKVDGRFYGNEGTNPAMLMSDPNNTSYWGMGNPDGANNVWIRTTSLGIIPFQSGGASAGHGGIGTSSWYFASSYIQNMYGTHTGNVVTSSITHRDGGDIDNGSWVTGATGTAPTATTEGNNTTYSGATIGSSIITLGNNKVGGNSASGVANNSQGFLRLYSSGSAYGELTGYTTSARTHIHASTGISLPENIIDIMFRPGSGSYYTHIAYETSGNEALVAATQNAVTSFIFVNGESYTNVASDRWTKLTGASGAGNAPGLQIKQNCVSIGELIPSGTNATYKLNVNGTSNFKGNMTSTGNFYTSGRHISLINGLETDQFIDFAYAADPTVATAPGASWRIGALNSGSGDGNYFVIQTGGSATTATTWNNALRFGMNTYDAGFGGNIYPLANNNKTLGTSSLKWNNVYATTFTGNLTGNATSADSAKWLMNRGGSTVTISDGPWAHGQTGYGGTNAATVWHQRWKQSGLTYTPSGGSATTLTDSGDMVLWLAQSATSNALTVNMAIDGIIYAMGGFKGNLNGQASTVARATFGDNGNGEHNANNIKSNGLWYYTSNGPATTLGASTGDGAIYSQAYSTSWAGQIAQDYRDGALFVRGLNSGTWKNWYAIPKFTTTTGGLGSATQPVYIDTNGELQACTAYGSASVNYAASAGSVAWANTGHPSTFPPTIGTTSTTAAAGDHTHTISLTQTGTSTVNLAANTVYTLTAGGSSVVFKTPADGNTDTKVNVTATAAVITKNYLLMTSTAPTTTATGHTALGSTSLWVNSADKGKFELVLGNATATTTAGGQFGQLALYSASTAGTYLKAADGTAWKTQTLQAKDGTIALTSDLPGGVSKTAAGLCPQLPNETTTTKFLRQDGTWQVPAYIADTHYTTHLYVNATAGGATSNAATANTTTYMHLYDNSTKRETIQFKGSGATTVTATGGVITISSTDNNNDTKNTAGSTNSDSKLYLIGATSQAANPQTYSDAHVFETNGAFSAKTLGVNADTDNDKVTLQWNSTDSSLDFVFA